MTVYCPVEHPYRKNTWHGVRLQKIWSFEHQLGTLGTVLYDFMCLLHATWSRYDVVLELGYGPSGLFFPLRVFTKAVLVTNMDGLEWKRSKWGWVARRVWLQAEKMAVKWSDGLIADNPGISEYLKNKFGISSTYIGYGANLRESPDPAMGPDKVGVHPYKYYLIIARLEPENNIEMILDGYVSSSSKYPIFIIGNANNKYGQILRQKYQTYKTIQFLGGVYDYEYLASLRHFALQYFHGHSVGGTNPALLEAMACGAYICAHNNRFNRYVLGSCGKYFNSAKDVKSLVDTDIDTEDRERLRECGWSRLRTEFNWEQVSAAYLATFDRLQGGQRHA